MSGKLDEGSDDPYRVAYGDDYVDVTDSVICYKNGKTFSCSCGQGIGVSLDRESVICASCGRHCVDKNSGMREPPKREEEQSGLSDWA